MARKLTPRQIAGRANRAKRKGLSPEGREALRAAALRNRPWEHSTGPRTPEGKERSRANAWRHGERAWLTLPEPVRLAVESLRAAERSKGLPDREALMDGLAAFDLAGMPIQGLMLTARYARQVNRALDAMRGRIDGR